MKRGDRVNGGAVLALYKVIFLIFVCLTGLVALGGARVGGKQDGETYGKENFNNSFQKPIKSTPFGYARSLLSILYAFRGWYGAPPPRLFGLRMLLANADLGRMRIM